MLGRAARFSFSHGRALLEVPAGASAAIENRRRLLMAEADRQKYLSLDKERLGRRAARVRGRLGGLYLGAATTREKEPGIAQGRGAPAPGRLGTDSGAGAGGGR